MKRIKSFRLFESEIDESDIDIASIESECDDMLAEVRDAGLQAKAESDGQSISIEIRIDEPREEPRPFEGSQGEIERILSYLESEGFSMESGSYEWIGGGRACPKCGSEEAEHLFPEDEERDELICAECGFSDTSDYFSTWRRKILSKGDIFSALSKELYSIRLKFKKQ